MKQLLLKTGLACLLGLGGILFLLGLMTRLGSTTPIAYAAGPRYVAPGGSDSGNDCTSSATPCATIQHAVDVADPGDGVKVAAGVYTEVNDYEGLAQVVYISKSITLQGGYTPAFTEPADPMANPTTLDAQGLGRVIYITGTITATVEGLRITGGNATGLYPAWEEDSGGGVYAVTATVRLSGNTVFNNIANTSKRHGWGGGIALENSIAILQGNHILSNTADITSGLSSGGHGGGVFLLHTLASLDNNTIQNNLASLNGEGAGGGVALTSYGLETARAIFNNNIILDNTASKSEDGEGYGGGIYLFRSEAVLNRNLILHNAANISGYVGAGGGVLARDGIVTMTGNSIVSNTASLSSDYGAGGGIGLRFDSQISSDGDLIQGNRALGTQIGHGGGLYFEGGVFSHPGHFLTNTVIISNQVNQLGTGIYIRGTNSLQLLHPTIAHNTGGNGAGIHYEVSSGSLSLTNGIIANQMIGVAAMTNTQATLEGVLWHDNGANTTGPGTITVTNTYVGNPAFALDGYHLGPTSAAIDKGVASGVTTDIDGDTRDGLPDLGVDEGTGEPDALILTKTGPSIAYIGEPITYTLKVANNSTATLTNLVVTDTIPTGASYITGGTKLGQFVRWTRASLAVGAIAQFTFVVTATQAILNEDYVVRADNDIEAAGSLPVFTQVEPPPLPAPKLSIGKSGPFTAPGGGRITYTLRITNSGTATATNLVITDTLPAGATYVSGGTKVGNRVRWTLPNLAANGGVKQVKFVVTASQTITNSDYAVRATGGYQARGLTPVVTLIESEAEPEEKLYLPLIFKK